VLTITPAQKFIDAYWPMLCELACREADREPMLAPHLHDALLDHKSFDVALANLLAHVLADRTIVEDELTELIETAFRDDPSIVQAALEDLLTVVERDPATDNLLYPFLFYRGYHALQCHRFSHWLWCYDRCSFALLIQSRIVDRFSIDIHPAACIGHRVMFDHGTGIVVGETSVIEDDISILHGVTLGGTGKESRDRHPKIRRGVLIGAGAKILGNIEVGEGARVAAGSIVLKPVRPFSTVVGIPAREVGAWDEGQHAASLPAFDMLQTLLHEGGS
jgi:serine O-acetyltransferase